jgi:hypothetical protein
MIGLNVQVSPEEVAQECDNADDLADFLNELARAHHKDEFVDEVQHLLTPAAKEFLCFEVLQLKSFVLKDSKT